LILRSYAEQND